MKQCNQCGKCCILYGNGGLSASVEDIAVWERQRPELLNYVVDGKIWVDPDTGVQLTYCPWLQKAAGQDKYTCQIYHHRPEDCRHYPVDINDMLRDDCEMLEPRDLRDHARAQARLDLIMTDSRPAAGR